MVYLYNLGIHIYVLLVNIVSPFNKKARLWKDGRKNWQKKIRSVVDPSCQTIWVHCSSLGEFEQGRPVIEAIKEKYPDKKIVLTFFSPSGYEVRKNYSGADYIFYLPIDTKRNAQKLIDLINPEFAVFVKYEFWYHYLSLLKKKKIPTYIISANFRDNQVFFKFYGKWYRNFLQNFNHLFVQNKHSQELLNVVGITNVTVSGDTRFDRVVRVASEARDIRLIEQFCAGEKIIIAGSTWPRDDELLLGFLRHNHRAKMIIAPHEINPKYIHDIQQTFPEGSLLFSQGQNHSPQNARLLIIDTIGLLASIYRYGHIAYIGGGFGAGIHNTLEAAAFGLPVIFGPNYQKFQEAKDLINLGAGFSINTSQELLNLLNLFLTDEQSRIKAGGKSKKFVLSGVGATSSILKEIVLGVSL